MARSLPLLALPLLVLLVAGCGESLTGLGDGAYSLRALHGTDNLRDACSIRVSEPEPADLQALTSITADEAQATALASFPSTDVLTTDLDNENGCLVYGVELTNGYDVKVDAGTGVMLYADTGEGEGTDHQD